MATKNDFRAFQQQARQLLKSLPKLMGKLALLEASDNFRRQGYEDEQGGAHQWAPRKARRRAKKSGARNVRQRALLVQSGRLRRSPRIVATTPTSVKIGTDVPYAQPLQEGNKKLPARPFLTVSKGLREKIVRKTAADITNLLRR